MKFDFLLVDDDEIFNMLNNKVLINSGLADNITILSSAPEALEIINGKIKEHNKLPDIILLDIRMPVMDGFGFLEAFHNYATHLIANTKICMLSSSLDEDDKRKAMAFKQVIGFYSKPLSNDKVLQISGLLNSGQSSIA